MPITLSTGAGKRHAITEDSTDAHKAQLYETPPCAVRALLDVEGENLGRRIWEPACGRGAIVKILREAGHCVVATDLYDWQCPISTPGVNFLTLTAPPPGITSIVTNPPFDQAEDFVSHALVLHDRVFLLLRGAFLEGLRWYPPERHSRGKGFADHLSRVWMFAPRLPFMHRDGYEGPRNSNSGMPFAWYVFQRGIGRTKNPEVFWINPRDYEIG